ncbi:hypothetical protein [Hallella bergensis]
MKSGKSSTGKQRYRCLNCQKRFITDYTYKTYISNIDNCSKRDWAIAARY